MAVRLVVAPGDMVPTGQGRNVAHNRHDDESSVGGDERGCEESHCSTPVQVASVALCSRHLKIAH